VLVYEIVVWKKHSWVVRFFSFDGELKVDVVWGDSRWCILHAVVTHCGILIVDGERLRLLAFNIL